MRASLRPAILAIAILVAACGGAAAPSSDVQTASPSPAGVSSPSVELPSPSPIATTAPVTPTPSPIPTPTPLAAVSPSPARTTAPTPVVTPKPTPKPAPKPTPKPTAPPATVTLALAAQDLAFTPTSLRAPAGSGFRISFRNQDAGVDHSVAIRNSSGAQVFDPGTPVTGVASRTYLIPGLKAGAYTFYCTVHAFMTGNLTVN